MYKLEPFIHGFLLAFGLILPLGVQNVFVFSQGAQQTSLVRALPATITASLSDTFLILLAVLGISAIVSEVEQLRMLLMSAGVLFLLYMSYNMWKAKPELHGNTEGLSIKKQIIFALSVSLLNPHAILDTIGVIGTSALSYTGTEKVVFTATCIFVSWCWFIGLTLAGSIFKRLDGSGKMLGIVNKCSAIFIFLTACWLIRDLVS